MKIRLCRLILIAGLLCAASGVQAADRMAQFEKLTADYNAAAEAYYKTDWPEKPELADDILCYEANPFWQYIPRFVEFAQDKPDDEAAYKACQWLIDACGGYGPADQRVFDGDKAAWKILGEHHARRPDLQFQCFQTSLYPTPAREAFLRDLLARTDLPHADRGSATLALGELLSRKLEWSEDYLRTANEPRVGFGIYLQEKESPELRADWSEENNKKFKAEGIALFRDVLSHYADVPVNTTAPLFRQLNNLGEKAEKSLHALEHLTNGAEAPDIVGKDLQGHTLKLSDYRGRVVVLSFWFTGCGPCMGMIPEERKWIEKYKDQPFALLAICSDESMEMAQATADERKIDWPCWFDGSLIGPIAWDYNVRSWPTFYVLDKSGRIAGKNLYGEELEKKLAELLKSEP